MFEIVTAVIALVILLAIAFPRFFAPPERKEKKTVGSTYWGYYEGTIDHDNTAAGRVAVPKPSRKNHVVAGSETYARGPAGSSNGKR